jgi:hypothetical protein
MEYGAVYGAVARAKSHLSRGKRREALAELSGAKAGAKRGIAALRQSVERDQQKLAVTPPGQKRAVAEVINGKVAQANGLINLKNKIEKVEARFGTGGAPNGAGLFGRVPLYQKAASNNVEADSEWIHLDTVSTNIETGQTPDMPYMKYRVHGFVANAPRVGADILTAEDLKAKGHPNLFLGEGDIGVQSYDGMNALLGGLRSRADVESPNRVECKFVSYDIEESSGNAAKGDASADLGIEASLIVEVLEDAVYGNINALSNRMGASGLISNMASPGAGWVERVPLLVKSTDTLNLADSPQACLGWDDTDDVAVTSLTLQSEEIPYQDAQVVGLECEYIEGSNATYPHILLLEDFKVKGGASLLMQEGAIPAWNFLGDAREFPQQHAAGTQTWVSAGGWGVHKRPALRNYPTLDPTNRIEITVAAKNKIDSDGALGANGTGIVSYIQCWALVNRLADDVFGGPSGSMDAVIGMLE